MNFRGDVFRTERRVPPGQSPASRPVAEPAGKPGNGRPEPGKARRRLCIEPRKMYSCGQWINPEKSGGKPTACACPEGSNPGRDRGEQSGYHRGLRPGHDVTGVNRELGRSECVLAGETVRRQPSIKVKLLACHGDFSPWRGKSNTLKNARYRGRSEANKPGTDIRKS
jgi:hypothetical protein